MLPRRARWSRGSLWLAITAPIVCVSWPAHAASFRPTSFQGVDGAIELNTGADYVEPYFATKALIVAQDAALDVHEAALAWIRWALPRQRANGLFRRFRLKKGEWRDCGAADADDAMLALWMQLLYRMAPDSGMPAEWLRSIRLADHQLDTLFNRRLGLYHVSRHNQASYFMDNIEVYAALKDIARGQARLFDPAAPATQARAELVAASIQRAFWDRRSRRFRPYMEKTRPAFYPDVVAQVYPWLANLAVRDQDARQAWEQWKQLFGAVWITRQYDVYPWGLVALAAEKLGDNASAACWISHSDPLRGSRAWNVLEEAAWQALRAHFAQTPEIGSRACAELVAQR